MHSTLCMSPQTYWGVVNILKICQFCIIQFIQCNVLFKFKNNLPYNGISVDCRLILPLAKSIIDFYSSTYSWMMQNSDRFDDHITTVTAPIISVKLSVNNIWKEHYYGCIVTSTYETWFGTYEMRFFFIFKLYKTRLFWENCGKQMFKRARSLAPWAFATCGRLWLSMLKCACVYALDRLKNNHNSDAGSSNLCLCKKKIGYPKCGVNKGGGGIKAKCH